jgi:hypothetical protein
MSTHVGQCAATIFTISIDAVIRTSGAKARFFSVIYVAAEAGAHKIHF